MCGWQVKLRDPSLTCAIAYPSALEMSIAMVQRVEDWTCNQQVVGSNPTRGQNLHNKTSDILTSTLAALLFSSHPKRERNQEADLNYYASADNRNMERQLSNRKTKLNQILRKQACTIN